MSTSAPIKKVTLRSGKTRYRFVVDVGRKRDGRRDQRTRTFDTREEAKAEYARIKHETDRRVYVHPDSSHLKVAAEHPESGLFG